MKGGVTVNVDLKKLFGQEPKQGVVPKVDVKHIMPVKMETPDKKEVPRGTRKNSMIWAR